ncbi:AraC family transcriptional regulator ligand-binding domain-containing protein [Altererythrobacter sp.]|uniref:AraC family transcriptional regulator n=1 Tax=Altererythrobacter sp. TaxID=1872480 RepID=UPI003D04FC8C
MRRVEGKAVQGERITKSLPLTLGSDFVRAFLKGAELRGYDPEALLRKAGIAPAILIDPDLRLDGRDFQHLTYTIQGEMNDIFMGFMEQPGKLGLDREQGRVRFQCATLGEALRSSTQFREVIRNDISYEYVDDAKRREFTLTVNYRVIPEVDRALFHWHRLTLIYRYYSWLIGRRIALRRASFEEPEPVEPDARRRYGIFDCERHFDASAYSLTFDRKYLLSPIIRKSEAEHVDYVLDNPDWFSIPGQGASWARQTEQVIMRLQQRGVWSPNIATVAAMLSVGARTLRRNLARDNESFTRIKARMRCDLAIAYLIATDLPITVVAEYVGFCEPPDFTHAFVGWTGLNPSAYRERHAHDKDLIPAASARLASHNQAAV